MATYFENIRKSRGLSRAQVSSMTGLSLAAIGFLETGERGPGVRALLAYSKAFDVTIDDILDNMGPLPNPGPPKVDSCTRT